MKTTLICLLIFFSIPARAIDPQLYLVSRGQWKYANNKFEESGTRNYSEFELSYLRLKGTEKLSDLFRCHFSLDARNANSTTDTTNKTSNFVDEAYVTTIFSSESYLAFGKQSVLIGGREYDYATSDLYTISTFFRLTPFNDVGATFSQTFSHQNFQVQLVNGNKSRGFTTTTSGKTEDTPAQTKMGWAIIYYGDIKTGLIKPIIGYTSIPNINGDQNFFSGGSQFNFPFHIQTEIDFSQVKIKNNNDNKTTSLVGLMRYQSEHIKPFFKLISEKINTPTTENGRRTAYDLGLEYFPLLDPLVRYHFVFSHANVRPFAGNEYSPYSLSIGMKINATILK